MTPDNAAALARLEKLSIFEPNSGCQLWLGHENGPDGYGRVMYRRRLYLAHRLSYESAIGPMPTGLQLDHLCRVRCCINPKHLEPVTGRENVLRGISPAARAAKATRCPHGHPFSGENLIRTKLQRVCRACSRRAHNAYVLRIRGVAVVARGHEALLSLWASALRSEPVCEARRKSAVPYLCPRIGREVPRSGARDAEPRSPAPEGVVSESEIDLPARPARKAPSRPWGWERAFWFHMPQRERRLHYRCCWLPQATFNREDVAHGSKPDWWLM